MLFGYARVSTAEQNPDHQIDALLHAGVAAKDIYVDHASGAKASRPELDTVLRMLRDGDTLKITRLDRLGRSVLHLVTLGAELSERGVGLHVTEQGIDTTTAEGRAMFGTLSVLAGRGSTPGRLRSRNSSMTLASTPCSRSLTCSACPAPPSTAPRRREQGQAPRRSPEAQDSRRRIWRLSRLGCRRWGST